MSKIINSHKDLIEVYKDRILSLEDREKEENIKGNLSEYDIIMNRRHVYELVVHHLKALEEGKEIKF